MVAGCTRADVRLAMQPEGVWVLDQGLLKGHWSPWVMACSSSMDRDCVRARVVNFCTLNHLGLCLLFVLVLFDLMECVCVAARGYVHVPK